MVIANAIRGSILVRRQGGIQPRHVVINILFTECFIGNCLPNFQHKSAGAQFAAGAKGRINRLKVRMPPTIADVNYTNYPCNRYGA